MTVASSQDDGARERPRIGPVVAGRSNENAVPPATGLVVPPLFVRSGAASPAVRPAAESEAPKSGIHPDDAAQSTEGGPPSSAPIDRPSAWGEFAATHAPFVDERADVSADEQADPTGPAGEQVGTEPNPAPEAGDGPEAWDGWTSMPAWLRALEREAEGASDAGAGEAAGVRRSRERSAAHDADRDTADPLPEEWLGEAAAREEVEAAEDAVQAREALTPADAPAAQVPGVKSASSVRQLASRLEQIAATLRQQGPAALADGASDPLGAIIAAYILGLEDGSGGGNQRR